MIHYHRALRFLFSTHCACVLFFSCRRSQYPLPQSLRVRVHAVSMDKDVTGESPPAAKLHVTAKGLEKSSRLEFTYVWHLKATNNALHLYDRESLLSITATPPSPALPTCWTAPYVQMTLALKDKEEYSLGSLTVRALHTPCHTRGHVLFFVSSPEGTQGEGPGGADAPLVFSGDTLFVGGCGRFFEGDASQSKCREKRGRSEKHLRV